MFLSACRSHLQERNCTPLNILRHHTRPNDYTDESDNKIPCIHTLRNCGAIPVLPVTNLQVFVTKKNTHQG